MVNKNFIIICLLTVILSIHWLTDRIPLQQTDPVEDYSSSIIFKNPSTGWFGIYTRKDTIYKTTDRIKLDRVFHQ